MTLLAEPAGRLLERAGDCMPRGMTVLDRTRLIGQLLSSISDNSHSMKAKATTRRLEVPCMFQAAENSKNISLAILPQPGM